MFKQFHIIIYYYLFDLVQKYVFHMRLPRQSQNEWREVSEAPMK